MCVFCRVFVCSSYDVCMEFVCSGVVVAAYGSHLRVGVWPAVWAVGKHALRAVVDSQSGWLPLLTGLASTATIGV